jgi:transposase-like protein
MAEHRTFHVLDALEASPARTRRIWSRAAKDLILAEASVAGANIPAVARAHGMSVYQVFRWQREAQKPISTFPASADHKLKSLCHLISCVSPLRCSPKRRYYKSTKKLL